MKQDSRPRRSIGAAMLVGAAATAAAVVAGRVIFLKFVPGFLPILAAIADLGN